jgi:hypothetical protein
MALTVGSLKDHHEGTKGPKGHEDHEKVVFVTFVPSW